MEPKVATVEIFEYFVYINICLISWNCLEVRFTDCFIVDDKLQSISLSVEQYYRLSVLFRPIIIMFIISASLRIAATRFCPVMLIITHFL